jgi:hypothetical protein
MSKLLSKFFFITLFFSFAAVMPLLAQENYSSTMQLLDRQIQQDPLRLDALLQCESEVRQTLETTSSFAPVTIPVVVHILYTSLEDSLSASQVNNQIDVLNEAFGGQSTQNSSAWGSPINTEIGFCLATSDPYNSETSGIVWVKADSLQHGSFFALKFSALGGTDAWPSDSYLNVWVTNLGSKTRSYAQFPGGEPLTDGIVIDHKSFGRAGTSVAPHDQGFTLVREIGHWLNLHNLWGTGGSNRSDFVEDTPKTSAPRNECSTEPRSYGTLDMPENFMDATTDNCANRFTLGQKLRMLALLSSNGARSSLRNSQGCKTPEKSFVSGKTIEDQSLGKLDAEGIGLNVYPNPVRDQLNVTVDKEGLQLTISNLNGQLIKEMKLQVGTVQIPTHDLTSGVYLLNIQDGNGLSLVHKITVQR